MNSNKTTDDFMDYRHYSFRRIYKKEVSHLPVKRGQTVYYVRISVENEIEVDIMLQTTKGLPENCEYCGSKLEWDSVHLVCSNPNCSHKDRQQLKAWIMNLAPMDGIGWKTIEKVINSLFYTTGKGKDCNINITTITDGSLPPIPGVTFGHGEQGGWNAILDTLQNGKFTISQFLLALNIPGLGKKGAKAFEEYPYSDIILDQIANKGTRTIIDYDNLGKIFQDKNVARLLCEDYFEHFKLCYNLVKDRLISVDTVKENKIENVGDVVITGKLSMKRADFEQLLKDNGFTLKSAINKDTMYLITNDPNSGTSKNKKADELGVTKITEDDFRAKYSI